MPELPSITPRTLRYEDNGVYINLTKGSVRHTIEVFSGQCATRIALPLPVWEWVMSNIPTAADLQTQQLAWAGALIRKLMDVWKAKNDPHTLLAPGHSAIRQLTDEERDLLAKVLRYEI